MKTPVRRKALSVLLAAVMIVSLLPVQIFAAATSESTWTAASWSEITENDVFAVTMSKDGVTWALPTEGGGGSGQPLAVTGTVSTDGGTLTLPGAQADFGWRKQTAENGFSLCTTAATAVEKLYLTNANNGVRIGVNADNAVLTLTGGYLRGSDGANIRDIGVYNGQDWRCYKPADDGGPQSNIAGQTIGFWKYSGSTEPSGPDEPTISTIAEALAGAENAEFTVKGVVTLVDGKNIYVQDATGGICLYFNTAPADISLGDTVIGTGKRATYHGLPELSGATYEASTGLTLSAAATTIGALTTADVCTYVSLSGLEVTEVYDNNGRYTSPNITLKDESGASIQIYKAVVGRDADGGWAVKVGDVVDVKAAVGVNNTTLQLRNTEAGEITAHTEAATGLVTDLADLTDGAYVVIYHPDSGFAMTSETYNDWYLMPAAATVTEGEINEPAANTVWQVHVSDGTYRFTQGNYTVAAWLSGTYAELTSNGAHEGAADGWALDVCNAQTNTFYMRSSTLTTSYGGLYIELYNKRINNESTPVFCGYSTGTARLTEKDYGLQFYLVSEPDEPTPDDTVLRDGEQVVIYSEEALGSLGIDSAGQGSSLDSVPTVIEDGKAVPENGAYVFTVGVESGDKDYYTFRAGGKYLTTNDAEELFLQDTLDETGKWYLVENGNGYVIYNKQANYKGTPVCIEFFAGKFSGWTFKSTDAQLFRFRFYPVADGVATLNDVVNMPKVVFASAETVVKQADYKGEFTLDDLTPAEQIASVTLTCNGAPVTLTPQEAYRKRAARRKDKAAKAARRRNRR